MRTATYHVGRGAGEGQARGDSWAGRSSDTSCRSHISRSPSGFALWWSNCLHRYRSRAGAATGIPPTFLSKGGA